MDREKIKELARCWREAVLRRVGALPSLCEEEGQHNPPTPSRRSEGEKEGKEKSVSAEREAAQEVTDFQLSVPFHLIEEETALERVLDRVRRSDVVAIDLECVPEQSNEFLSFWKRYRNFVKSEKNPGLYAALHPAFACPRLIQLLPFRKGEKPERVYVMDLFKLPSDVLPCVLSIFTGKRLIGHNIVHYDLPVLGWRTGGFEWLKNVKVWDTLVFERLLLAAEGGEGSASLMETLKRRCAIQMSKELQVSNWGKEKLDEDQLAYAAADVWYLLRLMQEQYRLLIQAGYSRKILGELTGFLREVVRVSVGIRVDVKFVEQEVKSLHEELKQLPDPPTPNQLREHFEKAGVYTWFQERFGFVPTTDKGNLSVSALVLGVVRDLYPAEEIRKMAEVVMQYKEAKKVMNALESLLWAAVPNSDNIIANIRFAGAKTGRFVVSQPNLFSVPRMYKTRWAVPPEEKVYIRADFPAQELRIAVQYSQELAMLQHLQEGGDLHRYTAAFLLNKKEEEIGKEERDLAKKFNFGLLYGLSALGLLKSLLEERYYIIAGRELNRDLALELRERFFQRYSGLAKWHENVRREFFRNNKSYTVKTLGGRIIKASRLTDAYNYHGQASGVDISIRAANILFSQLEEMGWWERVRLVLLIHDEIILEADRSIAKEVANFLKRAMEAAMDELLPSLKGANEVPHEEVLLVFPDGTVKTIADTRD